VIVRLSEGKWMNLDTLHRFERFGASDESEVVALHVVPVQGPRVVLCDDEAMAVVEFLTDRTRPFPMLTMAPGFEPVRREDARPLPDEPERPTMADLVDESLAALRGMVAARKEDAALNVFQRFRRFMLGGGR